jgi:hypothetical protein
MRAGDELEGRRTLRTETAAGDRRILVAFDVEDAAVLDEDLLAAPDRTVRTDRFVDFRAIDARAQPGAAQATRSTGS